MLLGSLIREIRCETKAVEALLSVGDLLLLAEIENMRQRFDETAGEYVSGAIQRFAKDAASEDWLQLMGKLEGAGSPSSVCLQLMVQWALRKDRTELEPITAVNGCGCSAGNGTSHGHTA